MENCPKCNALFNPQSYVCEYCGYVYTEKVRTINSDQKNSASFEEAMEVIEDNLNVLHDLPKPNAGQAVVSVLRVIVAIYTFGIALIFWKKTKNRFDGGAYSKIKNIVERNIQFLKTSSKGSALLQEKIKVVETELHHLDRKINLNLNAKRLTYLLFIGLFIYLIMTTNTSTDDKRLSKNDKDSIQSILLKPHTKSIAGNLDGVLEYSSDKIELNPITIKKDSIKWEISVPLAILKPTNLKENQQATLLLEITEDNGKPISGLPEFNLDSVQVLKFNAMLSGKIPNTEWFLFTIDSKYNLILLDKKISKKIKSLHITSAFIPKKTRN